MNRQVITITITALMLCGCASNNENKSLAPVKVVTETINLIPINGSHCYSGTIEEVNGTSLSFSTAGTIKSIHVTEGQMVGKGQLIAEIDETTLKNMYEVALATKEQAIDAYNRLKQLHENNSLPEIQWIEIQTKLRQAESQEQIAKKSLNDAKLYAPFSGYIANKQMEIGQNVAPGLPIAKLLRIDQVKVKISVSEEEIIQINKGQEVQVRVAALGNQAFTGNVTEKGVSADLLSRTYEVRALINNKEHALLPGMVCEVYTDMQQADKAIVLPADIIQVDSENRYFVWTVSQDKAKKSVINIGANIGNGVIVTAGLQEGDQIIISGQQKVSEGMEVAR